jgi:hypothetical protein
METILLKTPNYVWKCQLVKNTWRMVEEGGEPNWFHRKMQQLCFGIKWTRIE